MTDWETCQKHWTDFDKRVWNKCPQCIAEETGLSPEEVVSQFGNLSSLVDLSALATDSGAK